VLGIQSRSEVTCGERGSEKDWNRRKGIIECKNGGRKPEREMLFEEKGGKVDLNEAESQLES